MLSWRLVTNLFGNVFLYFQKVKALARLVSGEEKCPKVPILQRGQGEWGQKIQGVFFNWASPENVSRLAPKKVPRLAPP